MLARIYGTCLSNHRFSWPTGLASYVDTAVFPTLRGVVAALEAYRGFRHDEFVRAATLAPCDFWIPDPGFVVEFDENQHFTAPRRLALSNYAGSERLGFSAQRWIELCERHNARDRDPPYRDEQRAWYDTLRDLVPPTRGLGPTVRLYARDLAWCSLNPDSAEDRRRFSAIARIARGAAVPSRRAKRKRATSTDFAPRTVPAPGAVPPTSVLRAALVFPRIGTGTVQGVPPSGPGAQEPDVPTLESFRGEAVDFVLFPEGYVAASDRGRIDLLSKLAADLRATLLVGAVEVAANSASRPVEWQILFRLEPNGSRHHQYTKHSTAGGVAFENPDWERDIALQTFELGGVTAGATICHDHYLGLLPRSLAERGARVWVNPSFDNVKANKWSAVLRLRAVENRFFALCTLHDNETKHARTRPFGFSPNGSELRARKAGSAQARPLSDCKEPGAIYIVEPDMDLTGKPLDWSRLPLPAKAATARKSVPRNAVRVAVRDERPMIRGDSGWHMVEEPGIRVETDHGPVYAGVVPDRRMLDAAACFGVVDRARRMKATPIIWNTWNEVPTEAARLALLMMGRAIECCAPVVISDRSGLHELVELSNGFKDPARRPIDTPGETIVDIERAWGLKRAFRIVSRHLRGDMRGRALARYRGLACHTE
ncbi:nitrilase-related carbon-nitrogen hydrolase [Candidatus Palauibacter sp.]|uniref:nitrilase-related carbon-nitrogen hydrolase n=1 Tax=Candidatus Palauibacter sp. TaxID=3101350 RepID=UPI003B596975